MHRAAKFSMLIGAAAAWLGGTSLVTATPEPAQMAQTTAAPSKAPRLLPLPPTMSMAQTWKVTIGRKSNGLTKPMKLT